MNPIKDYFFLDPGVVFLNHGSFGACPKPVMDVYQQWQRELERQPVAFLSTHLFNHLAIARSALGEFIHSDPDYIAFIPNATFGVNLIARSLHLEPGDEVLTTNHEYGASRNAWEFVCKKSGIIYKEQTVPLTHTTSQEFVKAIWAGITTRTKIIYLSHITSPTAVHFPVEEICARARKAGIKTIIDGAHTPGQITLDMYAIGADFYIGNCHKWLMAPKGSAFIYTRPEMQHLVEPLIVSWGWGEKKSITTGSDYLDLLQWSGTIDPSAYLSVPAAIEFQREHDWGHIKVGCHQLVTQAIDRICDLIKRPSYYEEDGSFHQMAIAPLPSIVDLKEFKENLYNKYSIEIPCVEWKDKQFLRISIQGYNSQSDVDRLISALSELLSEYSKN